MYYRPGVELTQLVPQDVGGMTSESACAVDVSVGSSSAQLDVGSYVGVSLEEEEEPEGRRASKLQRLMVPSSEVKVHQGGRGRERFVLARKKKATSEF